MANSTHSLTVSDRLPAWAAELARKYRAGEASHFLLHYNVYDLVRGRNSYQSLLGFLQRELLGGKGIVLYNRSEGITFDSDETLRAFLAQQRVADPLLNISSANQLPRDPARALPMIERFLYYADRVAVIINFLETIFPAGEISHLSSDDRNALVSLQRWLTHPRLMESDNLVVLIAESLADVHPRVRENARLASIRVPYPDENERREYLGEFLRAYPISKVEMNPDQLAQMTSGLNYVHLRSLLCAAQYSDDGLTYADVRIKKKEIIEAECAGLVEFIQPRHGLENVGGLKEAKEYLRQIAETIRAGNREEAPMGILLSGPVGTGKTFLAECFARDCGLNVVEFRNFRDKWVGSTEANLEKILQLLQALAPIVVLIDEADAALGNREGGGDSGVNQRVFSKIAAAMSNTANRGRILWILMTSRPDLLPIDLKRQGRCEEHISLFYPETEQDRLEIAEAMARKNLSRHSITDWTPITRNALHLSGADIESIIIRTRRLARQAGRTEVADEDLQRVAEEFTPARDEMAIEYQELVAAREATSRSMLPERFRGMSGADLAARIEMLRLR
ncbi:MAG: ATP-binding protein [Acidobacteria bacterium]|nr:ATP-binding protein [Acidobacteriota bacterium]MCW5967950.1 ATP-binding protein [Blastocatellales bacterium]